MVHSTRGMCAVQKCLLKQTFFTNIFKKILQFFSYIHSHLILFNYSHGPTLLLEQAAVTHTLILAAVGDPSRA